MKSKIVSILISTVMVAIILGAIGQNVGEPKSSPSETIGLTLLNTSAPISLIVPQSSSSSSGIGGLADSPWPMFRQNLNHTGFSPYDTSANLGSEKWSFKTSDCVESSPVIGSDGTIYFGSWDDKLYAITPNGIQKWSFTTGNDIASSPTIGTDGTIYFGSADNNLYAINLDGTEKWSFMMGSFLVHSSPAIGSDGTIYVGCNDDNLYAINPNGTKKWSFKTGNDVYSSPAIGSDGTIYVGSNDGKLYAIKPNGFEKWNFTTGYYVASSPAISSDGTIYVGSYDHKLYAINPDGTKKWSFTTGYRIWSSPAIGSDGTIYAGSWDHKLYAISPNGIQKWSFTTGDRVHSSPAIGSDGTIYVGSHDNKLYAINPDGTEKWGFVTGDFVRSSPAIGSDGTIYFGSYDNKLYAIGKTTSPPIADAGPDQNVNEGNPVQLNGSDSYDPDGTIEIYEWDFESDGIYDYEETANSSSDGVFNGKTTHIYGDNGVYIVTLRVTDDDGLNDTDICNITVNNVGPVVNALPVVTINEFESVTFSGHATDPGSDDLTFTWSWDYAPWGDKTTIYYNDGIGPDPFPSPAINPRNITEDASCQYGDDGIFTVTLTVSDDDGGSTTYITNITVRNVAPTIVNMEVYMYTNFTLRVAGEKWHSVNITLYEDDSKIWSAGVTRQPGSPDEQAAALCGYRINIGSRYDAIVDYLPNDPRVNGNVWGGNPVWVILEFQDGTSERLHHTFNVRKTYWHSTHWNHIDPWEVNLTGIIYRHNITFKAVSTDPGSDDLTFYWDFGDGGTAGPKTYFNNGVNPDPFPSPEINPINITDTVMHAYNAPSNYTVSLIVTDGDGGIATVTLVIVLPG